MSQIGKEVEQQQKRNVVERYRDDFAQVLPTHIKADHWVRVATGLFRRNPKLAQIAQQNPGSVLSALLDCARLGLEPGDTYHLVPFGREVVGIADYTGLIELVYRAGAVNTVKVEVVRERDLDPDETGRPRFEWVPSEMERPHHKPDWFTDRGELIGAYAFAEMRDGSVSQVVFMNRAEIEQVKAVSKTAKDKNSPWNLWPDRMWKKTVVRQLAKFVPTSTEYLHVTAERTDQRPDREPVDVSHLPIESVVEDIDGEFIEEEPGQAVLTDDDEPEGWR